MEEQSGSKNVVGDAEQQQRISSVAEIVETQFMLAVYAVRLLQVSQPLWFRGNVLSSRSKVRGFEPG